MKGRKNLILGYWSRLPFSELEQFVASLRNTVFDGDVCIFVDDVAPEVVRTLLAHGIIVERAGRFVSREMNDQASRFFDYLDFLTRHGDRYDNVMLSDLRDVVFQSDPFANPLPCDVVFAHERCMIGACPVNRSWVVANFGEAVAHHLRDCLVSCSGTTFGTVFGILQYLSAMTYQLGTRTVTLTRGMDQGVHNYLVHMEPVRNAWLDTTDSLVATMHYVKDDSVRITGRGVLIDGTLVPVLHQWQKHDALAEYIRGEPRFRLAAPASAPNRDAAQSDAVICFYHRERDAGWLAPFLGSLRCAGYAGSLHCVGGFDAAELALLSEHGCVAHPLGATEPALAIDNIAHLFLSRVIDQLAADRATRPGQVLVLDTVRAAFLRNPFVSRTIGLSAFLESATRIGESDVDRQRLAFFTAPEADMLARPVISSAMLRGGLDIVRAFYRRLFIELVGRAELLRTPKAVQGAFNKLLHGRDVGAPVLLHPNGAEAFIDTGRADLTTSTAPPIRIGGAVPFVVLNPAQETELMRAVRASLGIGGALATPTDG